jgi:glycosyltransferase involved in cell wall biosynthesis
VTVCATDACDEWARLATGRHRRAQAVQRPDGVTLRVFPNLSNRLAYRAQLFLPLGLDAYLRNYAATFDIAHLHACRNLPGAIAARRLTRARVPYVLAPNGTAPNIERHRLAKRVFDAVAGDAVLGRASRVIAVTEVERRQLWALGVSDQAIRVIPNPIDLVEFDSLPSTGAFRRRYIPVPGRVVLFLGKITPRKRVDLLVHAFARLQQPDTWLVVAGNDMGSGDAARSLAKTVGVEKRTVFVGLLRGRERLEALADADVLVYPSRDEIFGLVPLEALLSGTPVVVSDDSGCAEVIRATGGGQVVPGTADALARAIELVLESLPAWRTAAAAAGTRIRTVFDQNVVCAQLERLYAEVART